MKPFLLFSAGSKVSLINMIRVWMVNTKSWRHRQPGKHGLLSDRPQTLHCQLSVPHVGCTTLITDSHHHICQHVTQFYAVQVQSTDSRLISALVSSLSPLLLTTPWNRGLRFLPLSDFLPPQFIWFLLFLSELQPSLPSFSSAGLSNHLPHSIIIIIKSKLLLNIPDQVLCPLVASSWILLKLKAVLTHTHTKGWADSVVFPLQ